MKTNTKYIFVTGGRDFWCREGNHGSKYRRYSKS